MLVYASDATMFAILGGSMDVDVKLFIASTLLLLIVGWGASRRKQKTSGLKVAASKRLGEPPLPKEVIGTLLGVFASNDVLTVEDVRQRLIPLEGGSREKLAEFSLAYVLSELAHCGYLTRGELPCIGTSDSYPTYSLPPHKCLPQILVILSGSRKAMTSTQVSFSLMRGGQTEGCDAEGVYQGLEYLVQTSRVIKIIRASGEEYRPFE